VWVTSYCLRGHTASGTYVHWGSIAVDPRLIPMGSKIFVPGYGYGRAEDTGSAIYETITVYR
jgi:3D (Asp-Asp-Asp) domain-containing protein